MSRQRIELDGGRLGWVVPSGLADLAAGYAQGWMACRADLPGPRVAARRVRRADGKVLEEVAGLSEVTVGAGPASLGYDWIALAHAGLRSLERAVQSAGGLQDSDAPVEALAAVVAQLRGLLGTLHTEREALGLGWVVWGLRNGTLDPARWGLLLSDSSRLRYLPTLGEKTGLPLEALDDLIDAESGRLADWIGELGDERAVAEAALALLGVRVVRP